MSSKLATLHAGLIARKGEARPAIAHAAFSYVDAPRPAPQPIRQGGDGIERHIIGTATTPPPAEAPAAPAAKPARAAPSASKLVRTASSRNEDDDQSKPFRLTFRMSADQRRCAARAEAGPDSAGNRRAAMSQSRHVNGRIIR